ncbi:MAG TPA: lactonase family protein [Puia sp.]|nr:lactonase family protein [Puia sp.]
MRFTYLLSLLLLALPGFSQQYYLFVGTYTEGSFQNGASKGIYVYRFDAATGNVSPVSSIATDNPSYLALSRDGKFLYSVNETDGAKPGGVSAFSFDKTTGKLTFINKQASGGDDPAYISVDRDRRWAIVANYGGGDYSALPIRPDGSLAPATQTIQDHGTGPVKDRQEKAHVHSTIFFPGERMLAVCDLGTDKISVLQFNPAAAKTPLTPAADPVIAIHPGSGPRHTAFYPGRPFMYVIEELSGTIDAFSFPDGKFTPIQRVSSHPEGYHGDIGSADIHIAPGGRYLYASNRGDANNLAIFSIDRSTGKLTLKGFQSTLGKTPRNFMIDPTGRWLLVANQNGKNVVIFKRDVATGLLTDTHKQITLPAPVCLKMEPVQ